MGNEGMAKRIEAMALCWYTRIMATTGIHFSIRYEQPVRQGRAGDLIAFTFTLSPWCLGGNGAMDPYSSPYIIPNNNPSNPFPLSVL